ncbi:MAG: hypothetical protein GY757_44850 [bacterium]|nr:hypothetical protein [bacterium]
MDDIKTLFFHVNKAREAEDPNKFQLIEFSCDQPLLIEEFRRLRDLKKYVNHHYENYELKKLRRDRVIIKKPLIDTAERVYLMLEGKTIRKLSWGISWHKVVRIEQIEGDEAHLKRDEKVFGLDTQIFFGFNDWANCGLEYISYSSDDMTFLSKMQDDFTKKNGAPEKIVDFRGLDRLLKKGLLRDEKMLSIFLIKPNSHRFNRFIKSNTQLTFRSALKWESDNTIILLYKKLEGSPGERNRINKTHVVEFLPKKLYDFYEESFAQLLIQV